MSPRRGAPLVVSFGDPVLDLMVDVSEAALQSLGAAPGGCTQVSAEEMELLLAKPEIADRIHTASGGSAANVVKCMAALDPGAHFRFVGAVGEDARAAIYRSTMEKLGVEPLLLVPAEGSKELELPSACSLCLITPDGQRTMRTCLGASKGLGTSAALPEAAFAGARAVHCEGYCLYRPGLTESILRRARAAGCSTSLDVASFELVQAMASSLRAIILGDLVDVLLCNEQEVQALARVFQESGLQKDGTAASLSHGALEDLPEAPSIRAVWREVRDHVRVLAVSLGPRGCVALESAGGVAARAPGLVVRVRDTVGAGDAFAGGFLHAWLRSQNLQAAAECGCQAGAAAVTQRGATLDAQVAAALCQTVEEILQKVAARGIGPNCAPFSAIVLPASGQNCGA